MPRGNRTGPLGAGPMTGRGLGHCAGHSAPGYAHEGRGMGWSPGCGRGFGHGRGFGWRHTFRATGLPFWARHGEGPWGRAEERPAREEELSYLEAQAEVLAEQLDAIQARIDELQGDKEA
jgi:hypothetical protein